MKLKKIGGTESLPVDVRIIVTTNEDEKADKKRASLGRIYFIASCSCNKSAAVRERQG